VCGSCNRKSICWQQEKSNTSKRILLLLKSAENKGYIDSDTSKKYLSNKCYQDQKLPVIKFSFEMYQINNFWKERLSDKQLIVSEQLEGISEIIDQFSSKTMFALGNNIPEYNIKKKALKASIDILNIEQSYNINSTRVNIQVELEPCTGNSPCKNQLCEIINSEYNYNFRVVSHNCGSKIKNIPCQIIYSPQGKYRLELSQQQRASKNGVSGDSYLYKPLKDGKDLIVLSDGMGVGRKAECESMAAINLLETIIDAGFDEKLAINTINSALYLRNKEESFTTLDIAIFDTFTGQISFSKIGAVSSYIKRDWDLIEIDSASLPAGILNKIEVSTKTKLLKENDFVIMFTDGVIDSYSAGKDQEECVRRLLQNSSFETAEEMVNYIMEVVLSEDKEIKDDMTIAVFKIKKDEKKSRIINDFSRIK
ncbi:MAG: SpoIIE family protein phosphatase, partial [Halanaerobiales bacterium]